MVPTNNTFSTITQSHVSNEGIADYCNYIIKKKDCIMAELVETKLTRGLRELKILNIRRRTGAHSTCAVHASTYIHTYLHRLIVALFFILHAAASPILMEEERETGRKGIIYTC